MSSASANEQLVHAFYEAFAKKDWPTIAAAYHEEIHFTDPVFDLHGPRAAGMWRMLLQGGGDMTVVHSDVRGQRDDRQRALGGDVHVLADGSQSGQSHRARFEFRDGKIVRHVDDFSFWKWSSQALGPTGILLGWTPLVRAKIRKTANARLEKFLA